MPELEPDDILREMGITRWVLRATESVPEQLEAQVQTNVSVDVKSAVLSAKAALKEPPAVYKPQAPVLKRELPNPIVNEASLVALDVQVSVCTRCQLSQSRTNTVFGSGPDQADWMFIGEAPGQQEDRQGKPFVGRAGQLLAQMIRALDSSRERVYIANTLKCRLPDNREPLPEELQACEDYLLQQIKLVRPKVLVALGRISAQALLKSDQPLGSMRGEVYRYGPDKLPLIVTYHPAYLLRKPADKSKVWCDLLLANRQISG